MLGGRAPRMKTHTDCMSSRTMIKLPGLIDIHVHTRDPGAVYKEDFASCTAAALAGGITMIFAMPNTNPAVVDHQSFALAKEVRKNKTVRSLSSIKINTSLFFLFQRALSNARCDYAIYVGASSDNHNITAELAPLAAGLKMYLNETFTTLRLSDLTVWIKVSKGNFFSFNRGINLISFLAALPKLAKEVSPVRARRGPDNRRDSVAGRVA